MAAPTPLGGHSVAAVGGYVYSFGGIINNVVVANAYRYDPASNSWSAIASMPAPRAWGSAVSDGTYIYLLGGIDQNFLTTGTLWRYDPSTNTYDTSLASYTIPTYFHANPFMQITPILGPNGERWKPTHGVLPFSRVLQHHADFEALLSLFRKP